MMATAMAIAIVVLVGICNWLASDNRRLRHQAKCHDAVRGILERSNERMVAEWQKEKVEAFERGQASILHRVKEKSDSVFDRDTITPTNQKPRYVAIATRRAQAERASIAPVTHNDKVRENNARAIESAG